MQKQLTLSNQTFSNIREKSENAIYVDKTEHIYRLVTTGLKQKIFLSRPRRFGKSLLCSTFESLFKGEKEYFYDTYIEDKWDWKEKFPIMHIMFGNGVVTGKEYLQNQLEAIIRKNLNNYPGIELEGKNIGDRFEDFIIKLYNKTEKEIVIIIDEYDKPILDRIHKPEIAIEVREELKSFYSAIKNADEYLRFVFITGVSKFSQVSLFSGLNQLDDITFDSRYATICGYTKKEIVDNYGSEGYLEGVNQEKLKLWYNGYNFNCKTPEDRVYNPFGLLNFFNKKEFKNYWFKSATPTFLINLLKTNNYPVMDFESITVSEEIMDAFEIENLNIITLMFQTGYLTIKEKLDFGGFIQYTLGFPNKEVRDSLNSYLINDYFEFKTNLTKKSNIIIAFHHALKDGNVEAFVDNIKSIFSGIPYSAYTKNDISKYEGFYTGIVYSFLTASGLNFTSEDITNNGRIDFSIIYGDKIYIIELKVEQSGEEAFSQIKAKNYQEKYLSENKQIFLIGINFSQKEKNIESWEFEDINNII